MTTKSVGKLRKQLQLLVGENFPVGVEELVNWAGTEYRSGLLTVRPTTVSEIQKVVRAAVSLRLRVRAIGNGFSSFPGYPENGQVAIYLTNLTRQDGGPAIELCRDPENPLESELTVLASVTVEELLDFQLHQGVELLSNVVSRGATVGGIVTTATHGTGLHCKSISDQIVRMRVIDATGELKVYDQSDRETLNAVRGALGLFGIIYDVTFNVAPLSVVQVEDRWEIAHQVFYEKEFLSALVHNNVSIELHWCVMNSVSGLKRMQTVAKKRLDANAWEPRKDEIYIRTINRPPGPATPSTEDWFENRDDPLNKIYKSKHWFTTKVPATTPIVTHKMVAEWKTAFEVEDYQDLQYRLDKPPRLFIQDDFSLGTVIQVVPHAINYFAMGEPYPRWHMEFSFNLDTDCSNVHYAIMELINMIRAEAEQGRFPVIKICVRFTAASDIYLSPSYAGNTARGGSGNTCHIDMESFPGTAGWHQFAADVALKWLQIPGARPHWGRQWHFVPGIIQHLKQTCEEELNQFRRILEDKCQDTNHMFFTSFMEELLYAPTLPPELPPQPITTHQEHGWSHANAFMTSEGQVVQPQVAEQQVVQQQLVQPQVFQQQPQVIQQPVVQQQVQQQQIANQPVVLQNGQQLIQQETNGGEFEQVLIPTNGQHQQQPQLVPNGQGQYMLAYPGQPQVEMRRESQRKKKKWWQFGRRHSFDEGLQHQQHQEQQQRGERHQQQQVITAAPNQVIVKGPHYHQQQLIQQQQYQQQHQQQIMMAQPIQKQQHQQQYFSSPPTQVQQIPMVTPEKATLYYPGQGQPQTRGGSYQLPAVQQQPQQQMRPKQVIVLGKAPQHFKQPWQKGGAVFHAQ